MILAAAFSRGVVFDGNKLDEASPVTGDEESACGAAIAGEGECSSSTRWQWW